MINQDMKDILKRVRNMVKGKFNGMMVVTMMVSGQIM